MAKFSPKLFRDLDDDGTPPAQEARLAAPDPRIRLELPADASAPHIEEGAMLELESLGGRRCRVLAAARVCGSTMLETGSRPRDAPGRFCCGMSRREKRWAR